VHSLDLPPERIPVCRHYLESMCLRENCPYRHIKVAADARDHSDPLLTLLPSTKRQKVGGSRDRAEEQPVQGRDGKLDSGWGVDKQSGGKAESLGSSEGCRSQPQKAGESEDRKGKGHAGVEAGAAREQNMAGGGGLKRNWKWAENKAGVGMQADTGVAEQKVEVKIRTRPKFAL
jgi:hypothetical protein